MLSSIDLCVGYTDAHKQLKLIKTLNGIWAWFASHCAEINTQLDLPASSVYFQVAHQPWIEAGLQKPIPAGFALVTQTHTHSHPRIWKKKKMERISYALRALQHYRPPKAFRVPIFKESKGKTGNSFSCCSHSELLQITQQLISQRAMTHIKFLFNCLQRVWLCCLEHAHTSVICKMLCCFQLRQNSEPICTFPK